MAYNIAGAVRIEGELEVRALERSLGEIVRRHEVLRTRFPAEEGEARQVIEEAVEVKLEVVEVGGEGEEEKEEEILRLAREEAEKPFDLGRGPLLRVQLLRAGEQEHVLLLTMHHIVSDGWSMGVLVREMTELYGEYMEEEKERERRNSWRSCRSSMWITAAWQREWLRGEVLEEQVEYWRKQLGGVEALELPTDGKTERGGEQSRSESRSCTWKRSWCWG